MRLARMQHREPADQVLQFAHIAGPAIAPQHIERFGVQALGRQALVLGLAQEVAHQVGNVLAAFAQRRQAQRHDIEPVIEILAEQALLNELAQIAIGGGDDAHIGLDRRAPAHGGVFALLQHAQQPRLRFQRHVADFVEEQRAAFGLLEAADAAIGGAGKGAALMAEQFAFDKFLGDRRHVDGDEGAVAALAVIVQRARDQLLAGAASRP